MANARDWPNGRRTTMNYAAVNDIHDVQSIIIILYNGDVTTTTGLREKKYFVCVIIG